MRDFRDWCLHHFPGGRFSGDTYSCKNVFREEKHASLTITEHNETWCDHGTGEGGKIKFFCRDHGIEPWDGAEHWEESRERKDAPAPDANPNEPDARAMWEGSAPVETHPYLDRKGLLGEGLRITTREWRHSGVSPTPKGTLLIPARTIDGGTLRGVERILPDDKLHLGKKSGCSFGDAPEPGKPFLLAEGFATACAIRRLSGWPVAEAFGFGGLGTAATAFLKRSPGIEIVLCPDRIDEKSQRSVVNRLKEKWTVLELPDERPKNHDWDDEVRQHGLEAAKETFRARWILARAKTPKPRPQIVMWNAEELMKTELPQPRWAIPGILPEGLGILIGGPKLGKSLISLHFAVAVAIGGRALGAFDVERGSVLYLALEDVARRLQDRIRKMRVNASLAKLDFAVQWPRMDEGGLEELENWLKSHKDARLVIIDTLQCFRPPKKSRGDSYAEDYAVMRGLKRLADEYSVPILVVHHSNKAINRVADGQSKDFLEASLGSQALTGAVDAAIVLSRSRMSKTLTLSITGRDVEEKEVAVSVDVETLSYRVEGDPAILRVSAEQGKIVKALRERKEPMSPNEIAIYTGMKPATVRSALSRLLQKAMIETLSRGKYGIPSGEGNLTSTLYGDTETSETSGTFETSETSGTSEGKDEGVPLFQRDDESCNICGCSDSKGSDAKVSNVPDVPRVAESTGEKGALLPRGSLEKIASTSGVPVEKIRESMKPLLESGRIVLSGNDIYENPARPNVEDPSEAIEDEGQEEDAPTPGPKSAEAPESSPSRGEDPGLSPRNGEVVFPDPLPLPFMWPGKGWIVEVEILGDGSRSFGLSDSRSGKTRGWLREPKRGANL